MKLQLRASFLLILVCPFFTYGQITIDESNKVGIGLGIDELIEANLHASANESNFTALFDREDGKHLGVLVGTSGSILSFDDNGYFGIHSQVELNKGTNVLGPSFFRISSNGKIGIGTTSPEERLHINNGNLLVERSTSAGIFLYSQNNANGSFEINSDNDVFSIFNQNKDHIIQYIEDDKLSFIDNLHVETSGRVGIGTSQPSSRLDVTNDGIATLGINSDNNSVSIIRFGNLQDLDPGRIYYSHANDFMLFYTDNEARLKINSNGNVGVGNINATKEMDIDGELRIRTLEVDNSLSEVLVTDGLGVINKRDMSSIIDGSMIWSETTTSGDIYYDVGSSGGNVGIGTDSPEEKLDVAGGIKIGNTTTDNAGTIKYSNNQFLGFDGMNWVKLDDQDTDTNSDNQDLQDVLSNGASANDVVITNLGTPINNNDATNKSYVDNAIESSLLWTETSDALYYNEFNVGIGTTTPSEKLHNIAKTILEDDVSIGGDFSSALELHIDGTGAPSIGVSKSSGDYTNPTNFGRILAGANGAGFTWDEDKFMFFSPASSLTDNSVDYAHGMILYGTAGTRAGRMGLGIQHPKEKLHIDGGILLGSAESTQNGTIQWNGTDFEGRKGGSWVSLTDTGSLSDGVVSDVDLDVNTNTLNFTGSNGGFNESVDLSDVNYWNKSGSDLDYSIGNVGIGTSAPDGSLEIKRGAGNELVLNANAGFSPDMLFKVNSADKSQILYNDTRNNLEFRVNDNGTIGGGEEHMVINTDGQIGIGTVSPESVLEIMKTSPILTLKDDRTAIFDEDIIGELVFKTEDNNNKVVGAKVGAVSNWIAGDMDLVFSTRNGATGIVAGELTEKMRILDNGNVGIGTNSPQVKLQIEDTSTDVAFGITSGNTSSSIIELGDIDNKDIGKIEYDNSSNTMMFLTSANERLTIKSNGLVGIGTSNPSSKLDISNSTDSSIEIQAGNTYDSKIKFADTDDSDVGSIEYVHSNNSMKFRTNNTEKMTIQSGGNVGIGTSSPNEKLHNVGSTILENDVSIGGDFSSAMELHVDGTGTPSIGVSKSLGDYTTPTNFGRILAGTNGAGFTWDEDMFMFFSPASSLTDNSVDYANGMVLYGTAGTSAGRMGLGIQYPNEKLHIDGGILLGSAESTQNGTIQWNGTDFEGRKGGSWVSLTDTGSDGNGIYDGNGTFTKNALVGLNDFELQLVGASSNTNFYSTGSGFEIDSETGTDIDLQSFSTYGRLYTTTNHELRLGANGSEVIRLETNGNVGIGTIAPSEKLHVAGGIKIGNTTTDNAGTIKYSNNEFLGFDGTNWVKLDEQDTQIWSENSSNPDDIFYGNGNSGGKVGIGTDSPDALLHVKSSGTNIPALSSSTVAVFQNSMSNLSSNISIIGDNQSKITFGNETLENNGFISFNHLSTTESDFLVKTGSMGPTDLILKDNGNLGLGTPNPLRTLDLSDSGQITFGDAVQNDGHQGVYWHANVTNEVFSNYGIYRTEGAWDAPTYQQLKIKFNTGVIIDPGDGLYDKSYLDVIGDIHAENVTVREAGFATLYNANAQTISSNTAMDVVFDEAKDESISLTTDLTGESIEIDKDGWFNVIFSTQINTNEAASGIATFYLEYEDPSASPPITTPTQVDNIDVNEINVSNNGDTQTVNFQGKIYLHENAIVKVKVMQSSGTLNFSNSRLELERIIGIN